MNPTRTTQPRPTQRKPKRIKAQVVWTAQLPSDIEQKLRLSPNGTVAVIDVSDEAALIEQVAKVMVNTDAIESGESDYFADSSANEVWRNCIPDARAVLESLGIITRKRTRK